MFILIGMITGFLLNAGVFWFVSGIFHWISFSSISSFLITAFLYTIIIIFSGILLGFNLIARIPLEILGLWLLSKVVSGFHIAGFWQLITTYIFFLVVNFIGGVLIEEADKSKF
jgi:uncharacterized membrane protein YvlD (DUF360 family)